jgi:dihydrofolate synthase / folylpolyglutamate synthase
MPFSTLNEAIRFIFMSKDRLPARPTDLDEFTRDITPTRNLLLATGLLNTKREYAVVTGSKGKGSVTVMTAKILEALGHTVGMISSPHLVSWMERIRVNGTAISEEDFMRIMNELEPFILAEVDKLAENKYISPQGIFLLVALKYFNEKNVTVGIMEVGRGGRYDDVSLVPNSVSVFTPIFLEHTQYLGDTVERIAWHKSGIIKTGGYAYSVAQEPPILDVIQREADSKHAEFFWFSSLDTGEFLGETPNGVRCRIGRYGEMTLPFIGRYQIDNATLAIQAAGRLHGQLGGIAHNSAEYVEKVKDALEHIKWYGRLQKLQDQPPVFVEGAINALSVQDLIESLRSRLVSPVITIVGVPQDRDIEAVYRLLAKESDILILTENHINPNIKFPSAEEALALARQFHKDVHHTHTLAEAITLAKQHAWDNSTVLMAVAQPLVGEAMLLWGVDTLNV